MFNLFLFSYNAQAWKQETAGLKILTKNQEIHSLNRVFKIITVRDKTVLIGQKKLWRPVQRADHNMIKGHRFEGCEGEKTTQTNLHHNKVLVSMDCLQA